MKEEKKFTKEEAVELLGNDNITANIYDLLKAVDAKSSPEQLSIVYAADDADLAKKEEWEPALKEITTWLDSYKALNQGERLSISDLVVTGAKSYVHGVLLIVNGMNGQTQVSRQSLRHVMDIMGHLEDYYGARAFLSSVGSHSDVYYYTLSFVIWRDHFDDVKEKHIWGNLRPLYHL